MACNDLERSAGAIVVVKTWRLQTKSKKSKDWYSSNLRDGGTPVYVSKARNLYEERREVITV